jgi:hypothetical protein
MEYAPADFIAYSEDQVNMFSTIPTGNLAESFEPVSVVQNTYDKSIVIKELLLNCLHGTEILPIDTKDYQNKEIDEMISKLDKFSEEFIQLDSTIHYMKSLNEEYDKDETIKEIMDKMNSYSVKINENDKLEETKQNYIEKRKEINKHLHLMQKINKWNHSAICPICITNQIDSYCNPCGHTSCKGCLERSSEVNHNKCPICREYVMDIRKLYFI